MRLTLLLTSLVAAACATATDELPFNVEAVAEFNEPWAIVFLPDGDMLVTEKSGQLLRVTQDGGKTSISGVPAVDYGGQGGLGDVVIHPDYANNGLIYLSYAEAGDGDTRGAVVAITKFEEGSEQTSLVEPDVIWRQEKVGGRGHYGHRLAFSPDGYLFISSGERQKFDPAQDMKSTLGKIIRLDDTGQIPDDNPFVDQGGVAAQIWSLGHRNPLGIAFDLEGRLWNSEMGPRGGDELNLVIKGANYGYPIVSNGDQQVSGCCGRQSAFHRPERAIQGGRSRAPRPHRGRIVRRHVEDGAGAGRAPFGAGDGPERVPLHATPQQ